MARSSGNRTNNSQSNQSGNPSVTNSEDKILEYLFDALKQTQEISTAIDNRCFGTISITLVLGVIVMLVSDISGIIENKDIFILFTPLAFTLGLSVYAYNFTMSAVTRGHLEGIESTINNHIGKNIFLYNVGFKKLYNHPFFTTNTVMGAMLFFLSSILSIFAFIYIFSNIKIDFFAGNWEIFFKIIYLTFSISFDIIYIRDLATTEKIREAAVNEFKQLYSSSNIS